MTTIEPAIGEIPVRESCRVLNYPQDPAYTEDIRRYQGCPSIAITKKGRVFAAWYAGGWKEPHMDNYNLMVKSDDGCRTWSGPILVVPSDRERLIHALDMQLWLDPRGRLWVYWVQQRTRPAVENDRAYVTDGYAFFIDKMLGEWAVVCDDPDADALSFSAPRMLDIGALRCKPIALKDGRWLNCNYDKFDERYGYSVSDDQGRTWTRHYGPRKIPTPYDDSMAVEKKNGEIHFMARTSRGYHTLAETTSRDGGLTWDEAKPSRWTDSSARFYYGRTPSGNLLLVKNDSLDSRFNMTVYLSEDDGETWPYSLVIDPRADTSYPDVDYHDGKIYIIYDRARTAEREILLAVLTEQDVRMGKAPRIRVVSKPAPA